MKFSTHVIIGLKRLYSMQAYQVRLMKFVLSNVYVLLPFLFTLMIIFICNYYRNILLIWKRYAIMAPYSCPTTDILSGIDEDNESKWLPINCRCVLK